MFALGNLQTLRLTQGTDRSFILLFETKNFIALLLSWILSMGWFVFVKDPNFAENLS